MVGKEVEIRKYIDGEEESINFLFNHVFECKRSMDEWKWKYVENPAVKDPSDWISLAMRGDELIGHYASMAMALKIGEKVVTVPSPVDSMIKPDSKVSVSVLKKLMLHNAEITKKHSYFGFGFPNEKAYVVGKRFLGYKDVGKMIPYFKRLSFRTIIKRRLKNLPSIILYLLHKLSQLFIFLSMTYYEVQNKPIGITRVVDSFDDRFDKLWDKVKDNYGIWTVRKKEHLSWRYKADHYKILVCEKDRELIGYGVIKIENTNDATIGYIYDLLYCDKHVSLLSGILKYMMGKNVDYVLFSLMNDDIVVDDIKEAGFDAHESFKPFPVVYFPFYPDLHEDDYIKDFRNWHLTYGDLDSF